MSTRISSVAALAVLAACSQAAETPDPDSLIECALGGAAEFARECSVERIYVMNVLELTVRHPDGGFRRFAVTEQGRVVAPADGAEAAAVTPREGGEIEVAVGADRYRIPAAMAGDGGR
jgi:hypothetical protein